MSFRLSLFLALLCSVCVSQTAPSDKPSTFCAHGRVIEDPSGKALRKVDVHFMLRGESAPKDYSATTDAEGNFQLDDLKPGPYAITLDRPGFVQVGQRSRWATALKLNTAEDAKDLILHMQPAAVIAGKIVDKDGDPIPNVNVQAARSRAGFSRYPDAIGFTNTNDLGEFRISNLRPDRYILMASAYGPVHSDKPASSPPSSPKATFSYALTYYPGTLDKSQAVPLELHPGDEISITFSPVETQTFSIRGTVAKPTGLRILEVMLREQRNGGSMQRQAALAEDGSFEFIDVLPGTYVPYAMAFDAVKMEELQLGRASQPQFLQLGRPLEITNTNLEGVRLAVDSGGSVRGRFRMDKGQKIDWTKLVLMLRPTDQNSQAFAGEMPSAFSAARLKPDGSFDFSKVPAGEYYLAVSSTASGFEDYFTKSIELDGKDVADSGFTVSGGSYALDVVIGSEGGTITGTVLDAKGKPAAETTVMAVPNGDRRKRFDVFGRVTSDAQGNFKMRGLIPGEYTVLAWQQPDLDLNNPEVLASYETQGKKVQVEAGRTQNLSIKVTEDDGDSPAIADPQ